MEEYKLALTRKFPFVKKRSLTETEQLISNVEKIMFLYPVVLIVIALAKVVIIFDTLKRKINLKLR